MLTISAVNNQTIEDFLLTFGEVFENTPLIARQAYEEKPFDNLSNLHHAMAGLVRKMTPSEQLILIQNHPQLGQKGPMASSSVNEQKSAGLWNLELIEQEKFIRCNEAYQNKFGFPFIVAVAGKNRSQTLAIMEQRLENNRDNEIQTAIEEIIKIAWFRLEKIVHDD